MNVNLRNQVLPHLERLRLGLMTREQRICVEAALANLNRLSSVFAATLRFGSVGLTPRELEVADLIKQGRSSKEAAEALCFRSGSWSPTAGPAGTSRALRGKE